MNERVTGIIHVHSDFSRDGSCSIATLADFARQAGFQFVGLTDHSEDVCFKDLKSLRRQCEKHSDESFVMMPGLEFRCADGIHLLGVGITDQILTTDAVIVATQIGAMGGLAILAHPGRSDYQCSPELCSVLDGIEIWNAAYDGRFVPALGSIRLLQEARRSNPTICGFGGADLHGLHSPPGVALEFRAERIFHINTQVVLRCLQSGTFTIRGRYVSFNAHTGADPLAWFPLWGFRKLYEIAKAVRDATSGGT